MTDRPHVGPPGKVGPRGADRPSPEHRDKEHSSMDQREAAQIQPEPVSLDADGADLTEQARLHLQTAEAFALCYDPGARYALTPVSQTMALVHATIAQGLLMAAAESHK